MGSVAVLTTSGDNDPELEPVQSYRHYLYCDACGSFDLERWETAGRAELESRRRRLASVALWATPLLLVPAWEKTGIVLHVSLLVAFAIGIAFALVLFAWLWGLTERIPARWRFVVRWVPWLAAFLGAESLCEFLPGWGLAAAGAVVVAVALARRAALAGRIESLGLRCRGCSATYGHQTAFFQDLEANPRGLTVSDVPRPLGRSPFLPGKTVE
jgi:hypothetical protein